MTCGTTLCPSTPPPPPPPPPILSSNTSAAQVVLVAVPRATRTTQRFVIGEKYLTCSPPPDQISPSQSGTGEGGRKRKNQSQLASDAPTSPQPTSPKCSSTLCFSALNTSLPDIASGDRVVVACRVSSCPDVDVTGMNSMRSQRFW